MPNFDIRPCSVQVVADLVGRFHGYGSMGNSATYAFAVYEGDAPVAAYAWAPPPLGAANSACPEAPAGVLALSRMAAVPKDQRRLAHISKPLRHQMRHLIDRERWPVLVTYSDEGQGHTGHVYKCSGWRKTARNKSLTFLDAEGHRVSGYSNGKKGTRNLTRGADTMIQRWEHRVCAPGQAAEWMARAGWVRVAIPGKVWASGSPAYRWVKSPGHDETRAC